MHINTTPHLLFRVYRDSAVCVVMCHIITSENSSDTLNSFGQHSLSTVPEQCQLSLLLCAKSLQSCDSFVTPWTVAPLAPLLHGTFRQEY